MNKTKEHRANRAEVAEVIDNRVAVNINTLAGMMDCGLVTARRIGANAGARVQIGKRVLYRLDKINAYLDRMTEDATA